MMLLDISGTLERRKQIQGFLLPLAITNFGNSFTKGNKENKVSVLKLLHCLCLLAKAFGVNFCSKKFLLFIRACRAAALAWAGPFVVTIGRRKHDGFWLVFNRQSREQNRGSARVLKTDASRS
jgi:hypothetical protein